MPQVSKKYVAKDIEKRIFEVFEKTLTDLKDKDEVKNFIADIFTPTEKIMFSKRLAIAVLLAKGYDYREIGGVLKVSSTTINSILKQQSINGQGYKKAVEKILRNEALQEIFMDLTKLLAKGISHPSQWGKVDSYYSFKKKKLKEREV